MRVGSELVLGFLTAEVVQSLTVPRSSVLVPWIKHSLFTESYWTEVGQVSPGLPPP